MKSLRWILAVTTLCFSTTLQASSIEKAEMLSKHGLINEARSELINIIFEESSMFDSSDDVKAAAYYLLGSLAFQENDIAVALDSWTSLVERYPSSEQAEMVSARLDELAEIVGESAKESTDNAIASSYMRHGDFWSKGKSTIFSIDSSWIPNVESAIKWYDKVISEFPKSVSSRLAYQAKLRTILGWKESGRYGSSYGIQSSPSKYFPLLLSTFNDFERDHPDASTLQGFRYQIAQAYWNNKEWDQTRVWLNKIIEVSGGRDSFYRDLAQRRLKKVEY